MVSARGLWARAGPLRSPKLRSPLNTSTDVRWFAPRSTPKRCSC